MAKSPSLLALLLALMFAREARLQAQLSSFDAKSGEELYRAACAACHGADGSGNPPSVVGFDTPLPDFTDCGFATPETDFDWAAVAHEGGPVRAFDRRMPAFGHALSEAAILRVIEYVRGFCRSTSWPRGELNLPRPLVTEKAFPENEAVVTVSIAGGDLARLTHTLTYERRLGARSQLELAVPVEMETREGGAWRRGLGDAGVALKHTLFHSLDAGTIVSVGGDVVFPTGRRSAGPGKGVVSVEPFIAMGQILASDGFVQVQSGVELPTDGAKEAFVAAAVGKSFIHARFGRTWSPMIEFAGTRELVDTEGARWDLIPQMQVTLSKRQHVIINAGLQIPLTSRSERGLQVLTYLLWDWFDGGFFDGWR